MEGFLRLSCPPMTEFSLLPSQQTRPRHAAPRDPSRSRAVMLPGVLLAAAGTAFAGLAILPASPAEIVPRISATEVLAPVVLAAPATANLELVTALQKGAEAASIPPPPAVAPAAPAPPAPAMTGPAPAAPPAERASRDRRSATESVTVNGAKFARPAAGRLTSPYGRRWGRLHAGIDLAAGTGSPIRAVTDGTVLSSGNEGGYGLAIRLLHPDGTVSFYGHMSSLAVSKGARVVAGQQIGKEGNTGNSTGPHLHFEVRVNDVPINPAPWLKARGIST